MSERELLPEIDEEQAKTIDRNLALGFAFLRDVLHRPGIVAEIPSGSTLAYRAIPLPPFALTVRLTAFRPRRTRRWSVRVTGCRFRRRSFVNLARRPCGLMGSQETRRCASWLW
jgi:hypothetical protein